MLYEVINGIHELAKEILPETEIHSLRISLEYIKYQESASQTSISKSKSS